MYSPSGGDTRATAQPNARDSSSSMPIDHAATWQREPYNREVRLERGDRDRVIGGKRDWNSDRASSGAPFQRALGLHSVNGNFGPPNKRRLQGRHSGFYTENGRYGVAASRGEPSPFGVIPPLENGLARKFERDPFHVGSEGPVASTGFSNGPGIDCRSKDLDERHKREPFMSYLSSGEGRDAGSSAVIDLPGRPYHSQVLAEVENSSWDRDRSKGVISNVPWESAQRSERDHRERAGGKPDLYSRRAGQSAQFDAGREWALGDKDLEGSRLDRYGSSSRDSFPGDSVAGGKEVTHGSYDWRSRERSAAVGVSRTSPFAVGNGILKDSAFRPHGLDVSGSLSSPQHSPHSTPPSSNHEQSRDDGSHPSPPKRPRLGWGQGLAKYEKKKVGDSDETAPAVGSGNVTSAVSLPGAAAEAPSNLDVQADVEAPTSLVLKPTSLTNPVLAIAPSKPAGVPKFSASYPISEDGVGKPNDEKTLDEVETSVTSLNQPEALGENVSSKAGTCVIDAPLDATVKQADPEHFPEKPGPAKEPYQVEASPSELSISEQSTGIEVVPEVLSDGDMAGWTKEAILQRVEKVEFEIDQVEREIAKLEHEGRSDTANGPFNLEHDNGFSVQAFPDKEVEHWDGFEVMEEDAPDVSTLAVDGGETLPPLLPLQCAPCSPLAESVSKSTLTQGEDGALEMKFGAIMQMEEKQISVDEDHVATSEEGELKEGMEEEATSRGLGMDGEWEGSAMASPAMRADLLCGQVSANGGQLVSTVKSEMEDKDEVRARMVLEDLHSLASTLMIENQIQARHSSDSFVHLLTEDLLREGRGKLYSCPAEAAVWKENLDSHNRNHERMVEKVGERQQCLKFTERVLTMRFRALKDAWQQEQLGLGQHRGTKPVRRWEIERRNGTAPPSQRSSLRLRPIQPGTGRLDALSEEAMKKLMTEPPADHLRAVLKMPAMILGERDRMCRRFYSKNALIEDPVILEKERKTVNPWTLEEKKIFLEKFALYNKNFSKISGHLDYKTTGDCVEFYYRNQKSEDFEKIRRRQQLKKRRDYSRASASYLATGLPTSSRQREANAARIEALNVQAAAAAALSNATGTKAARSSCHHKPLDRARGSSSSLDPTSLPPLLDTVKPLIVKENKTAASVVVPVTAGVNSAVAVVTTSSVVTIPCGLSSATPPPVKSIQERNSSKIAPGAGLAATRIGPQELHTVKSKGARSKHARRDLARTAGEEADAQWTDGERQLFTDAVAFFGKDFQSIAQHVGSKSQSQCKSFFSKTRKRLRLDMLVEQFNSTSLTSPEAARLPQSESTDVQMDAKPVISEEVKSVANIRLEVVPVLTAGESLGETKFEIEQVEEEANSMNVQGAKAVDELLESVPADASLSVLGDASIELRNVSKLEEVVPVAEPVLVAEPVVVEENVIAEQEASTSTSVTIKLPHLETEQTIQVPKEEKLDENVIVNHATGEAVVGLPHKDEDSEAAKGDRSPGDSPKVEVEAVVDQAAAALVKISNMLSDQQEVKLSPYIIVKPEPGSPQVATSASTDSASLPPVASTLPHSASTVFSTTASIHNVQQTREKPGRVGPGGEIKPRREPTSWTQEEKEKFAEIIRKHGKDWTRLHDCLPAKSLTQIKTYFQNSKAKLGLLTPDGLNNPGGRGTGSRKRKADDSDTSSNNVGSLTPMNQQKAGSMSSPDVDVTPLKVNPVMAAPPSMPATMTMGTTPVGAESLAYALFGPRIDQDPMSVQKFIRQMCSTGGFAQNTPPGLYPFLHPNGMPVFPASGLQRSPHSNLQQQLAASVAAQKPSPLMSHQQVPLQSSAAVQQTSQPDRHQQAVHQLQQTAQVVARNQQQLLQTMMQQQAAHLQQQQQQQLNTKAVLHPLQQVVVLQQAQAAAQRQQQQQLLHQQVVHHPQPQQAANQQQQGNASQQVGNQPLQVGNAPQVSTQLQHLHHQQQQALLQQQKQQLQQMQQHQQLQQQQQEQAQVQAQAQAQAQAAQVHTHMHPPQPSHTPLLQPLVSTMAKPHQTLAVQPIPQQFTKIHSSPTLQQGGLLQHHDQQQQLQGSSLSLHRGVLQSSSPCNSGEGLSHPSEMGDLRGSSSNGGAAKHRQFSREDLQQQLSAAVQRALPPQQAVPQRPNPTSAPEAQQGRPGDVKLFGQSLLCQPTSSALTQSGSRVSGTSTDRGTLQQQPVFSTSSTPVTSMAAPSVTLPKVFGKDSIPATSAFRGVQVPFMLPDSRHPAWPLTNQSGNMGLWNLMSGLQAQGPGATKQNEGEPDAHSMQEAVTRMSDRLTRDGAEGEQAMPSLTHKMQHVEQLRGVQDFRRNEGLSNIVHGLDKPRASMTEQGVGAGASPLASADINRVDSDRRNDVSQSLSSGGDRGSTMASRTSRGQPESFAMPAIPNSQQMPRAVMNALMALADWQNSRNSQQSNSGPQRLEELQAWESVFRQGLSANAGGLDSSKANSSIGLTASLPAQQPHLSGELLQQCVRDSGMYFTPQHLSNLAGHHGVTSSAWNNGAPLLHASDTHRLVNPSLASFHSGALTRAPTGTEEQLRPADSRDPDSGSGGVG